MLDDEASS